MPTKKPKAPVMGKIPKTGEILSPEDAPRYAMIPGHGGRITFVEDGVVIFIPKSFIESWPLLAVKISKKEDRITFERAEEKKVRGKK